MAQRVDAEVPLTAEAVAKMGGHAFESEGRELPAVRGWVNIRQAYLDMPGGWIASAHARLVDGTTFTFPVIPDEFNQRPGKLIKAEDKPHVFSSMEECEKAANKSLDALLASIREKLGEKK